ncbi:hypothetical protein HPB48_018649 [Haemaphysalis longicornis]|uniref:Uncharacterized protein n=1 Tax=Haemaphysalis longicornis TaxID=44386 RepID=A0A9J6GE34_HAELO|nr:hypothetical protein HPB48_018649 [Haemaphysalis longicornis]
MLLNMHGSQPMASGLEERTRQDLTDSFVRRAHQMSERRGEETPDADQEPLQERKGGRKTTIALTVGDSGTTRGWIPDSAADCAAGSSPRSTPSEAAVREAPLRHVFTAGCFSGAARHPPRARAARFLVQGKRAAVLKVPSPPTRFWYPPGRDQRARRRLFRADVARHASAACTPRTESVTGKSDALTAKADVISRSRFVALPVS